MANSKIILTFHTDLDINQQIGLKTGNIGSSYLIDQKFVWLSNRLGFGQVTKGTPTANVGERSAINFVTAYNADWNFNGTYYTITRVLNVVTITVNFPNIGFYQFFCIILYK